MIRPCDIRYLRNTEQSNENSCYCFKQKATDFYSQAKPFQPNFFIGKNIPLNGLTRQAKLSSQLLKTPSRMRDNKSLSKLRSQYAH